MQSLVLDKFDYGIISNPDQEDISDKAASYSLNIDGDNEDGKLKGIPTTSAHGSGYSNIRLGEMIEKDGIYDLVYHDKSADTISVIVDFYNTNSERKKIDLVSSLSSDNVTMVLNNKEVHVGIEDTDPYWIGHCSHGQLDLGTSWTVSGTANASGLVRVTVSTTHSLRDGNLVRITGIVGTTEANGIWKIVNTDAVNKTFDLVGSTYANAWVSGGTAYQHLCIEVAMCETNYGSSDDGDFALILGNENNAVGGYFVDGIYHEWTYTLTYDGYQESPISTQAIYYDTTSGDSDYYPIAIYIQEAVPSGTHVNRLNGLNARITSVNIYRRDSTDGNAGNVGLFRKIVSVDINNDSWATIATYDKTFTFRDYGSYITYPDTSPTVTEYSDFVTYTENSGMPQSLTDPELDYALSTKGNGKHFVSNCYQNTIVDCSRYIFSSKELRFDMFDWTNDFLVMPRTPTALEFYEGKLYAFDANHIYRINPEGLYIEDAYEGVGALGQRSVLATAYGMFFCNDNGAYVYRNGQVEPISEAIKIASNSNGISWQSLLNSTIADTIVAFDSLRNQVLFMATSGSAVFTAWVYHVTKNRWDYWTPYSASTTTITLTANSGAIIGKDGEVYISNASELYKLLRGGSQMGWEWISKEFHFENPSQDKWLGAILVDPTTNVTVTYGTEGTAWTSLSAYTHGNNLDVYKKTLQIKVAGTTTAEVDSIEIIYRNLVGRRYYA